MAYAALISLKHTIQRLINLTDPEITKSVYEELESLCHTLKRLDASSNRFNRVAINALDAQIREAVSELQDSLESAFLDQSLRDEDSLESAFLDQSLRDEDSLESAFLDQSLRDEDSLESAFLDQSLPPSKGVGDKVQARIPLEEEKNRKEKEEKNRKEKEEEKMRKAKKKIDTFLETVEKLEDDYTTELENPGEVNDDAVAPAIDDLGGSKSTPVGFLDQTKIIRNELLDGKSGLKVVSLVGMAGIGKTFFARKIYQHRAVVRHFDLTVWVRVGPNDQIKHALVDIVSQIEGKTRNLYIEKDVHTLGALIQKSLQGRKYLIVLDDIWSTRVCNTLRWWLPTDGKGRRVLLTTRLEEVAQYHNTSIHHIPFLTNEESWYLFRQNVFAEKSNHPQLYEVGKKIVENCEGLPLLILVVANILHGLEKTEEYWQNVADKKTTTFEDAYEKITEVLFSSYEYLPQYLKPCFLYMGVFPQSFEISLPKLINLWTVEDILEPNRSQTSEDLAMQCLTQLVSKSLVIVCKQSSNYRIKAAKLHSVYWHLCVKEARKNKIFHVLNTCTHSSIEYMEKQRRIAIQNNALFNIKEVYDSMAAALTAQSLLCTGEDYQYPVPVCLDLLFLKVLDALSIRFYEFPVKVLKLLQLKYLALSHKGNLPSSISRLQKLQSLIFRQHHNIKWPATPTCLPNEIWDMQELRHLLIKGSNLPDPSHGALLPNLLTLHVKGHSCTESVFRSIPKLKKLRIEIELQPRSAEILSCFKHVSILHELESLKCVVVNPRLRSEVVAPPDRLTCFPRGLRKLSLNGIGYSWEYISVISLLPNLQVLKLRRSAFRGPKWDIKVGEFPSLEFLLLEESDVVYWRIDGENCFPSLRRLVIGFCYKLMEIPSQIGAIPTLETMEVIDCRPSAVEAFVKQIREEGNYSLQVLIDSSWGRQ